jgi:predicted GNAT family acetyltransferase
MAEGVVRRYSCRMPVRDNTALSRFEFDAGGVTAFVNYRIDGGVITFLHTETPPQARGQGIASQLIAGALQIARARGLKVKPLCAFVRTYIAKHPEFRDLLA